jgi:transposase-like protein
MIGGLTAEEFDAAVAVFPRLSAEGKAAARLVLVSGLTQAEVAGRMEIHRQQVNKWCKDIFQSHLDCPDGWVVDVVVLPPDLMAKVKDMERKARDDHGKE